MPVLVEELTEKVLAASNAMKLHRERMERTAHSGAEQPADDTDFVADADEHTIHIQCSSKTSRGANDDEIDALGTSPSKRLRTTDAQRSNREISWPEAAARNTKQHRITAFFSMPSAASASSGDQLRQAITTTGTDDNIAADRGATSGVEPKQKQERCSSLVKNS